MTFQHLRLDVSDRIGTITLDRPEKLNALSRDLHNEMVAAANELQADDDVRVVIVTGAGRGFCSGADLTARPRDAAPDTQNDRMDEFGWVGHQALAFGQLDKPTIAAVNGVAAGAGMSLALSCDLRVASEKARFKVVFLERSLSPDAGMTWFLPHVVGYPKAVELVQTSRFVESDEALAIGLVNQRVPHEELMNSARALATEIAFWPPLASRAAKRVMQRNLNATLEEALRNEITAISHATRSEHDVREAQASFIEKRAPVFTGE
ncbi:MAG: enoyl-CoA hydratase-related protein [Chloroflexi bacterium]|nr:enoyl-CoA hydratase-related protein [Chloroflexota bacterium]MCY3696128.1 enoyl-CoA hydratase-related protein [Chloroflexota bacterium]